MRKLIAAAAVATLLTAIACKTTDGGSSASDDEATLLSETKASLKDSGCLSCHADTGEPEWRAWAAATKDTHTRLATAEAGPAFDPVTFDTKGIYKAYPEYFRKYFTEDDKYEAFVDGFRPDPGMRVRGSADLQRDRFALMLEKMLQLADETNPAQPANP